MKLSILICTTTTRVDTFLPKIIQSISKQLTSDVEVIYLGDNKMRSVGKKRNDLINLAQGEYLAFVDDDDTITEDYVDLILKEIKYSPDVIVFQAYRHHDGKKDRVVKYSNGYEKDQNLPREYRRIPNHLSIWKTAIAVKEKFREINYGEDSEWAIRMKKYIRTERGINKIIYHYWYNSRTTETQ